jgi:hypothetical protein
VTFGSVRRQRFIDPAQIENDPDPFGAKYLALRRAMKTEKALGPINISFLQN